MDLDEKLKQNLIDLIKEERPIPSHYKNLLFPPEKTPQEYELTYGCKERKEDVLADTLSVPFQAIKQIGNPKEGQWHNKLVFGDNLQALKFMLKNPEVKGKVRLIYIDPPFATGREFRSEEERAYQDMILGAEFLEFLRKRLILLREILADNGSIYVHLDWKKVHYMKVLMDEIFGEGNFVREIIWRIGWVSGFKSVAENWVRNHDTLLFYAKDKSSMLFNKDYIPYPPDYERWGGRPKGKGLAIEDVWGVFPQEGVTSLQVVSFAKQYVGFPTQKPEGLLARIIKASSNERDLVLDCFAGSGTTGAVAEKLGRRWIMVDSSKWAVYTMIKRMLNLKREVGNTGKPLRPKPFIVYNAGLYDDHDFILTIGEEKYRNFAMELFQVEPKQFEINGLGMDGLLFNCPVKVFSREGFLTEEYIDELHNVVGEYLTSRMFIIAPVSRVYFLQDYIEKDGIRYYVLRIPYSIIDELHKQRFTRPMQPTSANDINQMIDAVGFDFVHPPNVKAEYRRTKPRSSLVEEELVIEIKEFSAVQRFKEPIEFEEPKDALSMVLVDRNYNGEYFNMSDHFFQDQIKEENWKVWIPAINVGKKIIIIYLDVFGNEAIEVKSINDFKR